MSDDLTIRTITDEEAAKPVVVNSWGIFVERWAKHFGKNAAKILAIERCKVCQGRIKKRREWSLGPDGQHNETVSRCEQCGRLA